MRRSSFSRTLLLGACLAVGLGACQVIAGIEERKLDPNLAAGDTGGADGAGGDNMASTECSQYCTRVMAACTSDFQVYINEEVCLGICALMDPGEAIEPVGNTVACRSHQAKLAEREPQDHCLAAGPGGAGVCGSDCEAYCQLFPLTCPDNIAYPTNTACLQACSGLTDQARFDVLADHEGDTIECRLVHVSSAASTPDPHCGHAPLAPGGPWCRGEPADAPTCAEYCSIALAACTGDLAQYEDAAQCEKVCASLEPGTHADRAEDTVGCRRYHAFSATLAAETHCSHAGPSGDGHCGDASPLPVDGSGNCDAYCSIAEAACPSEFGIAFSKAADCHSQCSLLDEAERDSKYSVESGLASSGLHCRLLQAARAFDDPTACPAALGSAPCN